MIAKRPALTPEGERFAVLEQNASIVARVALQGYGQHGWPDIHVKCAIEACNEKGKVK